MNSHGRLTDVMFENFVTDDPKTGMPQQFHRFWCWADKGLRDVIKRVEGVSRVTIFEDTKYLVTCDERYDLEFVKREVEAEILCRKDTE